jgi:uncharacterized protein (DUF983 family)
MITETTDVELCEVHSDAGGKGQKIECPNCGQTIIFAPYGWWEESCECGTWDLTVKATLNTDY